MGLIIMATTMITIKREQCNKKISNFCSANGFTLTEACLNSWAMRESDF